MTIGVAVKVCTKCSLEKPVDAFHKHSGNKDGLQDHCKDCRHAKRVEKWDDGYRETVTRTRDGKTQTYTRTRNHGESKTPLYRRWKAMKERCHNPNAHNYRWYGARGITVDPLWREDFFAFKEWALSTGYDRDLELDRINNDGPYSPTNCRWVTKLTNKDTRAAYLSPEMEQALNERAQQDGVSIHTIIKRALEAYL